MLNLVLCQVLHCLASVGIFDGVLLDGHALETCGLVGIHVNYLLLLLLAGVDLLFLRAHGLEDLLCLVNYLVVHINWLIHH